MITLKPQDASLLSYLASLFAIDKISEAREALERHGASLEPMARKIAKRLVSASPTDRFGTNEVDLAARSLRASAQKSLDDVGGAAD